MFLRDPGPLGNRFATNQRSQWQFFGAVALAEPGRCLGSALALGSIPAYVHILCSSGKNERKLCLFNLREFWYAGLDSFGRAPALRDFERCPSHQKNQRRPSQCHQPQIDCRH